MASLQSDLVDCRDLIPSLSKAIDSVLRPLMAGVRLCALLDFPDYPNVGDSAIWLGERAYLRRASVPVVYAADYSFFSSDELTTRLKDGVILLHGGGNLGDLWPVLQEFREKVIAAFPDRRIIQLPQTIHFQEISNLRRAKAVFNEHPDLTILVRDVCSLELARNEFRAQSVLCPDMAFSLEPFHRPQESSTQTEIVWLSRSDIESRGYSVSPAALGVEILDWLSDDPSMFLKVHNFLKREIGNHLVCFRMLSPLMTREYTRLGIYDRLAGQRLNRGCRILGKAKVVITDRLHGHILSLLLRIPHVLLDNSYGKLSNFYGTWTKGSDLAVWVDSAEEALAQAKALVRLQVKE
jgi:exopolysaccharide biosynthesis predicted pyruvyltransferase EpsI